MYVSTSQLQRIEHAQDFIKVASCRGRVGQGQANLVLGVDDEYSTNSQLAGKSERRTNNVVEREK